MLKFSFLVLFSLSFLLNTGVKAQQSKFSVEDVMNKVKLIIPAYEFRHYKWPLPPEASYSGQLLGPEDIDVVLEFKKEIPLKIQLKNMDIKNNPAHLSVLTDILKMVDERYLERFMKFYKSASKSKKYDDEEEKNEDGILVRFEYTAKTKKSKCSIFFLKNLR